MKVAQLLLDLIGPPRGGPIRVGAPAPADDPAARVLAALRAAGGAWERVVFTRNRRIMASVARNGRDVRLHESFAAAPDEVLRAVATLFTARTARRRNGARAVVGAFVRALPAAAAAPRPPRTRAAHPGDAPHLERLRREFARVNAESFGGTLPAVPIHLSGRMRTRNGHFSSRPVEIVISRRLCVLGAPGEAEHTLRHEMVHLWQHVTGRAVDHGQDFRAMARRVDVHPRARRAVRWAR